MKKTDLQSQVTTQIINDMKQGKLAWETPYFKSGPKLPFNPTSKKYYSGINTLILWAKANDCQYQSNYWMTFKQASEKGAKVIKGEKGTAITYFMKLEKKDDSGEVVQEIPMQKTYYVFNLAQLENTEGLEIETKETSVIDSIATAEKMLNIATIDFGSNNSPCYIPSKDLIKMPLRESFKSTLDFYSTALHELTHWTGSELRLDRIKKGARFGSSAYAYEELVAELGAAFLCAELNLEYNTQHAAYIQSWIKALENDESMIFKAAADAQKAIKLIKERSNIKSETKENEEAA